MANIKISELNPLVTIQDADVLPIVDNAVTKKVTAAILRSYTQGNSVLLTGAQTVAGIKTFTAQLASSVATGTAPFSVASTTKVTNLNADLLDGLSSADFALSTRTLTAGTGLTGGGDLTANRTFAIDSTVATLTGTQTLTNKTITSPVINEILDSNGNEILGFTPIASATDYITIKNGIGVGVPLHISAAGSSANTGIHLEPKGTGLVQISDGTDTTKGFRFRSSGSAASAVTLLDAVSSAGRVITLPDATTTLVGTNTTDTLTNKSISGATNTLSNIGNASLTNSAITINGTSTSLGGSINVGTVTSVAALTLGTSGTDVSSTVANGTTTPVITLNVPTASAANRGALSSADWTTFNNKQNALTNPITGTGTTNYLPKFTGASALGNSIISESGSAISIAGNLGVSATINSWISQYKAIDIGLGGFLYSRSDNDETSVGTNWYRDGSAAFLYKNNGFASMYTQGSGQHTWYNAPSGTAGNAVTFTQAMTLTASGNLGLGTTSPSEELEVYKSQNGITRLLVNNPDTTNTNSRAAINVSSGSVLGEMVAITGLGVYLGASSNNFLSLITNGSSRLDITAGGNVLIGTTTDSGYKLDVNGTARVSGALLISNNDITQDGTRPIFTLKQSGTSKLLLGISSTADDIIVGDVAGDVDFRTNSQAFNFSVNNGGSIAFKLASNAAATFSSSVTASSLIKSGGTASQYLMADGSTSTLTNPITGTGTTNYLPKFTGASALGNSLIFDNGTNVGIGTTSPLVKFSVVGVNGAESGTATPNGSISIGETGVNNQLLTMGVLNGAANHSWIQSRNSSTTSTYSLALNPSGGNVLIGTTTDAGYKLDVSGTARVSGNFTLTTVGSKINFDNALRYIQAVDGSDYFIISQNAYASGIKLGFDNGTSFTAALTLANTGAATFSSSVTAGAGIALNSATAPASGIEFPATQVASASANNLDDYEEGTWTPSLGGNTTYTLQSGTYTKIGRQVTINFLIGVNILGTGSSSVVTGVPFTVNNTNRGGGGVAYVELPIVAYASINPAVLSNTTQLIFATSTILGAWADQSNVFTNGTIISGTVTYFV